MIKFGLLQPGLFTSYIPKVGEFFNSLIYSLLVRFRGPSEIGCPGARHRLKGIHFEKNIDIFNAIYRKCASMSSDVSVRNMDDF